MQLNIDRIKRSLISEEAKEMILETNMQVLLITWGLYRLHLWISMLGAVILILAQLRQINHFSTLYELCENRGHHL